ncbi:hypothetical protein Rleg9DRAFT_7300 [Rhizobium leguminosarum bv. trifolii WSM597]|uniref:Uncharacterized protein n=1 Tax=Rhizobium leguminosarum bv. trifolii WSM597 TaxID=754764 RepID=I9N6F4_RHILT|nr:hypothetical protein [Rhizobium leguminosarum]EJB02272.1 hypothetical protein Rleg9DRAFT_1060 [Rhizobium leguminosarum bv. trifolii WSM597]EJB08259.1 hypothetical protein Rleg9DRAFT_7300 [Rhizobium leguminosarum bv. trifolii WSM597]
MTNDDTNEVHQAVFGYSNGHRLLASSIQLSSVDNYELAAASDLAPGVSLDPSSSYLTGVGLPESKLYALIKTWAAPEMHRPGCVWSHVLLLSRPLLSSQIDLAVLAPLLRRPAGYHGDQNFTRPLLVGRRERASSPPVAIVEQTLLACYDEAYIDTTQQPRSEIERAIFAVWSQQWPRLRSTFVFRSIQSNSLLPSQNIHLRSEPGSRVRFTSSTAWLPIAADDAVAETVTPLRRFLWRYGKDIDPALEPFIDLVEIFMLLEGRKPSYDEAAQILAKFGAGQAQTLKRDILGIAPSKMTLVQSVEAFDLVRLMVEYDFAEFDVAENNLGDLFRQIDSSILSEVATALEQFKEQLDHRYEVIFDAILPWFTRDGLSTDTIPAGVALQAMMRRHDLISLETVERFSDKDLSALLALDLSEAETREVLRATLMRPPSTRSAEIIEHFSQACLDVAVTTQRQGRLSGEWRSLLNESSDRLVPLVADLTNGQAVADAARAMNFPLNPTEAPATWLAAFKKHRDQLDREAETTLMTFIMVLCIRYQIENTRLIAMQVMPDLRWRIVSGGLSSDDEKMLGRWLPNYSDSWDLNKRLLKLLRQGYKRGVNFDDLVSILGLSDDEYAFATNQDPENLVRQVFRAFMPWGRWDD